MQHNFMQFLSKNTKIGSNLTNFSKNPHYQLDSADEQAAAIRRELDGRMQRVAEMERNRKLMPKFVLKEMESLYIEELKSNINLLMANLESLPVNTNWNLLFLFFKNIRV